MEVQMQNHHEHVQTQDGGTVEVATMTFNGREYTALGACVTGDRLSCYLAAPEVQGLCPERVGARGNATDWNGAAIGRYVITARWRTPRSWVSSHMLQCQVTLPDGRTFTGRGAGTNMLWRGRIRHSKRGG
jgi:hypothetical protein